VGYQLRLDEGGDEDRDGELSRGQPAGRGERGLTRGDILNAVDVAKLLQLRRSTVEDYARRGVLPSIKLGRFRRFVRADVEAALAQLRDGSGR
jgi:excisionase family DNA binding protein